MSAGEYGGGVAVTADGERRASTTSRCLALAAVRLTAALQGLEMATARSLGSPAAPPTPLAPMLQRGLSAAAAAFPALAARCCSPSAGRMKEMK
ncbi:Os11g0473666 [Oryza sativa Japonica Group]|uniref:Os11g0473666 protein n=1 Tax=Oryza sativa subsp. japonica TaxID=39947 RepID=A0A0P0Y2D7_ORYSJ|nr:Os11g0473666 [Oryza sativa Japonica Group]